VVVDHQKKDGLSGLISVLGVKYTTARTVAEQAVDLAVAKLTLKTAKCQTHVKPVHGGQIVDFSAFLRQAIAKTPRHLNEEVIEHLVYTHGSEYRSFVKALDEPEMRQRIDPHLPVTVAEVLHAIHHEMAITLSDIVQRRTELGSAGLPPMSVLQKCAELMARELGWSLERQQQEIASVIQAYPLKRMERVAA
jgi:glycerol-3-phosphate dehydrogenase